ncbi:heme biosynthesis protein HemY [Azospirillum brasilense]|uniref:Heme biosynthesis protein HemY n=1 Tax=Azospirillum brasilense TaxID=192 RepID=A0A235HA43_AZOBR|nr:heme biosynthesis HemY N-terminal domain-containing protein [Azospirillum brasilense]OYD82701.1 heme biosynthesis protein HemY [Azospirillum brasilense]
MTRAIWFIIKVAIVVAIAVWLANHPGTVAINWQGYVVETGFGIAILIGVAALAAGIVLYRLARAILGAPRNFGRYRRSRRRERGYQALTRGMVAVAAGDATTARKMARKADGLLNEPPLTMLLSAQAAQLQGDDRAAKEYFTAMLDRPETAFLGLRGLLTQSLKAGDRVEALQLARRAQSLQPNTPWLLGTLYDLEARSGEWAAAEGTLQQAVQAGAINPDDGRRHRATLLLERSFEAERRGRSDSALSHAQAAHDLLSGFVPAAARAARLQMAVGKHKNAAKTIERCWRVNPHPDLTSAYREVVSSYDPMTRVKLFEKLRNHAPNDVESLLAVARAALDAQLWGEARAHLTKALEMRPSRRVFQLLAELERAERQDEEAARAWLAQAANAPADAAWTCTACNAVSPSWGGLCGHCGAFDSLEWKTPTVSMSLMSPESAPAAITHQVTEPVTGQPGVAPGGQIATQGAT